VPPITLGDSEIGALAIPIQPPEQDSFMTAFRLISRPLTVAFASALAFGVLPAVPSLAGDTPAATAAAPASAAPDTAAAAPAIDPNQVLATVNGDPITELDVEVAAPDLQSALQQIPADQQGAAILKTLVDLRLMAAAAEAAGLDKQAETQHVIAYERARTLRNSYLADKLQQQVTEDAIKARFDQELAKFVPGDQIHAEHILVNSEDEAKAIIAQLDKGGDFAAIAKEKSTDAGSGQAGGDLGWFGKGQTVKPFEDAAFALAPGKYTETPVKSDFGWHVIKVLEKRKEPAPTLADRHDQIRDELAHEVILAEIGKLHDKAKIVINQPAAPASDAPAPATQK
jgi:peptidyl-prolyl cis-trans isomerase C